MKFVLRKREPIIAHPKIYERKMQGRIIGGNMNKVKLLRMILQKMMKDQIKMQVYIETTYKRQKKNSHLPVLNNKNQRRKSVQLVQKQSKEWIGNVLASLVNVVMDANLSEWNQDADDYNQYGYQKDVFGVSRSHQSYSTQDMGPNRKVMGRWYNGVPMDIPN